MNSPDKNLKSQPHLMNVFSAEHLEWEAALFFWWLNDSWKYVLDTL